MSHRKRSRFPRRALIRGAGALGAALAATPFLPLRSEAGVGDYPKRLLLVFQPNGTAVGNWWPTGTETDWTLGSNLSALAPVKDKLLFLDGVYKYGQRYDQGGGPGNEHGKGIAMMWTGSRNLFTGGADWSAGRSIDQLVADEIAQSTPFRSIELGMGTGPPSLLSRMIYAGEGQPISAEESPLAAFDRMFEGITDDPEQQAAFERIKTERKSVIDLTLSDLERTKGRVGSADMLKIDAHLAGLRAVEQRLSASTLACSPPEAPAAGLGGFDDAVARAHVDNLVMALACDLTRVSSFQFGRAATGFSYNGTPHHDLTHTIAETQDLGALEMLADIDRWYAAQIAYLLESLDAVPEGSGTLLDNTLVVWGNEISNSVTVNAAGRTHLNTRVPLMMAGGGNFAFQTGRYVRYGQPADMNESEASDWEVMHHRVLVSILNAFGVAATTHGDLDPGSGPAPNLSIVGK